MPSDRLIERGRLAYQALACKERALRYQSAAATLAEAIALAEIGDESKLKELLEAKDYLAEIQESPVAERSPAVSVLVPQADSNSKPTSNSILLGNQSGDWSSMLEGAKSRRGSSPVNEPTVSTPIKQSIAPENKNALTAIKPRPESKPIKKNQTQRRPQSTLKKTPVRNPIHPKRSSKAIPTGYGLDVWISMAIHGVLLVVLGVWVVVSVKETHALSVVAATVESDEVLIETPMESIAEIDPVENESTSIESIDTSEIALPVDNPAFSMDEIDLGIDQMASMNSMSQQLSSAATAGNKMVEGADFFGAKATGNRFVYIVDASPSMRRDRAFDAAKQEILRSLQSMKPTQRFAILFFGGAVESLELAPGQKLDQPVSATAENIQKAVTWLTKVTIQQDGRPPIEAVKSALELEPDGIFLLFDGATKLDNWTQMVRKLNTNQGLLSDGSPRVPIHVIHFFREEYQRSMQQLASENSGSYRFVPRPNVFPGP